MLLLLTAGLLPLGLIAIVASLQSARENHARRIDDTHARVELKAQRLNSALSRAAVTIRAASAAIARSPGAEVCQTTLDRLARAQAAPGRYALFAGGQTPRCSTPGYVPALIAAQGRQSAVEISEDGQLLRFALFDDAGRLEGTGEFSRGGLEFLTYLPGTSTSFDLELSRGGRRMVLRDQFQDGPLSQTISSEAPVAGGHLRLKLALAAAPITLPELLTMLLPLLMWAGAAFICWFIVERLLLKPLKRMQAVVSAYQPGDRQLNMPEFRTPAREIGELGQAFDRVTRTVARHEAELEAAVERQTRLVREVHHRVKNNLQVVASLLNLHARGSKNEDVAAAYASIQRRVDALAVVHRNHYAELEENKGVALRSLVSELGANLRATAPAKAQNMAIRLNVEPFHVNQDVAVSVAFLITEVVEFAMFCGASGVTISVTDSKPNFARLTILSDALKADAKCDDTLTERFNRIVTGLSRQLRSELEKDPEVGRYSLEVGVVDKTDR